MSNLQFPSTINIQPAARVLKVLGEIEFHPWQCLAELIDNAFDDFLEIERLGIPWPDGFIVSVSLPSQVSPESVLTVRDTGRGMTLPNLQNAVRAGWSSNELFNKLGLFGVGFNIATARLGKNTRILTSPESSPVWLGVEINLEKIGDDFEAPLIQQPKDSINEHGTLVEVRCLDRKRASGLGKNAANIRTKLGEVYSYLLSNKDYKLYVNGVLVKPRNPCAWGESRYVTFGSGSTAEQIPAVIKIDHPLQPMDACSLCGNWQPVGHPACQDCGSSSLVERPRRIHGWLGIQRHVHKTDFGIDFLRNGRKILMKDKRLFQWTDPNDPLAQPELEYPVELGQGRIIGEIHLDHLPVNYQKNAFEWSDRGWLSAVDLLRGAGPLLPKRAKQMGYEQNESPLGKLHKAFRRTDPGYRYLIPGDGVNAIHGFTLDWRDEFYKGDPEFQSDQKWWDAVVHHEEKQNADIVSGEDKSVLDELGLNTEEPSTPLQPYAPPPPPKQKTDKERIAAYKDLARVIPELSKEYGLHEFGAAIQVTVFAVSETKVCDKDGNRIPLWFVRDSGAKHLAFVDVKHPVFRKFNTEVADLVLVEIANFLKIRQDHDMSLSQAIALLKEQRLPDLQIDAAMLAGQARELLDDVRARMIIPISENPERAWQHLSMDERAQTETNLVIESNSLDMSACLANGDFMSFTPMLFTARVVEEWPDAFLDGKVFRGPYSSVSNPSARRVSVSRVVSYLYDVALLADAKITDQVSQLARARLSLQLLRLELSPGPVST